MTILLFKQVLIMFSLAGVGYICYRTKKITLEGSKNIANILIYLSLPCVIINSFLVDYSKEKLMGLLYSSMAALVVLIIGIVISRVFFGKDAILNFAAAFSNPGFFGIPLIVATLSNGAVFYVATFIAFLNFLQWSYGVALLTYNNSTNKDKGEWKKYIPSAKRVLTAPFLVAVVVGVFFFVTQIEMPELIYKSIQHIAGLNTPLAMFTIGVYFAQTNPIKMLKNSKLYLLSLVRLIIIPVVCMLVLMVLPAEFAEMKMALLIAAACPTGANVAVYAQLYDSDYGYAVETVIISTLFSVITIPILVQAAMMLGF
ncbi:MAG: AEC family transporter [Lachnospiraceae bacterium]|nr:AEC family transporter [Lachnospiraceae bacterium]MBR4083688.1 AEC family transporter [Lachnospiraceae bacterium]